MIFIAMTYGAIGVLPMWSKFELETFSICYKWQPIVIWRGSWKNWK